MKRLIVPVLAIYLTTQFVGAAVGAFAAIYYGATVEAGWLAIQEKFNDVVH